MKTTKSFFAFTIFSMLLIAGMFFNNGCGTDSSVTAPVSLNSENGNDMVDSITIEVTKMYGGYMFKVTNRTLTTIINDFHVQFDKKIHITDWSLAWQFDPNTTDLNNGKIGEKAAPSQPPIQPGQSREILWIKVDPDGNLNFNWQATKDGVTVQKGTGKLP